MVTNIIPNNDDNGSLWPLVGTTVIFLWIMFALTIIFDDEYDMVSVRLLRQTLWTEVIRHVSLCAKEKASLQVWFVYK
jgi:hypothetical protein